MRHCLRCCTRRANEAGKPFDFSNSNDIFSKREDAEQRLKLVRADGQPYFIEIVDCPLVYSDDLELHPQCVLETKNKFCHWHDATDYLHKSFHRLILDKEDVLADSAKDRLRKQAPKDLSGWSDRFKYGTIAVSASGYSVEAYFLMALLEEFKKLES